MPYMPGSADIEALSDVVNDITELSDSLPVDTAVRFRVLLVAHLARVRLAIDMLDQQLVKTLEVPVTHGGWIHQRKRKKERQRFDHDVIAAYVRTASAHKQTPTMIAEEAVRLMRDLYVSPSTTAKIGALEALGIDRREVETFERGALVVEVVPVMSEVQE